jgi:antirestriction protein
MSLDTRRIYAADLAAYNAGRLCGVWIDVTDPETMQQEISEMLRQSPTPNVSVACPNCEGSGKVNMFLKELGRSTALVCDGCKGSGQVPSAEEWLVHDYDGEWFGLASMLGETSDLRALCELSELIDQHGEAYAAYVGQVGQQYATPEGFEDAFLGTFRSVEDYAEDYADSVGLFDKCNDTLKNYFNFEAFARDMQYSGDISAVEGGDGVFIFSNH